MCNELKKIKISKKICLAESEKEFKGAISDNITTLKFAFSLLDFWFIVIRTNHIDYCEICKMERDLNVQ